MTYNTTGIILSYRDIGEYDRIYSILTRDHGKIESWSQGVRKPKSKLCGHLQPLYFCDFMFARGRRFDRIAQARTLNYWPGIWGDLRKLGQAMYAASLVDLVSRPGAKEEAVFELLRSAMDLFEKRDGALELVFSLKLLKEAGFSPELNFCVLCKARAEGLIRSFDAIRGGVLCQDCFRKAGSESFPASSLTLEILDSILAAPLSHIEMPEAVRRELNQIADAMAQAHFGEEPKARIFMDRIGNELYAGAMA